MRRMVAAVTATIFLLLSHGSPALAGGGFAGDPITGKVSGPAVSAVVVMDPTYQSPTIGQTGIVIQKGSSYAGATFTHLQAASPAPEGWVLGCDGTHGAQDPTNPHGLNVSSLTNLRFAGTHVRAWIPAGVLSGLLAGIGIQEGPHAVAAITSVSNAVCTAVIDDGMTKYMLSFTAVIQFDDPTK
jgi:hypothetical protein